jgi:hypothetical protein
MPGLDVDPNEEPRPDGFETEDELAEDLIPSPSEGFNVEDLLEGSAAPPEDDEDGGGMETEHETRSPIGGVPDWLLELSCH